MGFNGGLMGFNGGLMGIYPLVNIQKAMERSTIVNGKIHELNGPFSIAMLNYQRVVIHGFKQEWI